MSIYCNEHFENHIICSKSARTSLQMLPVNVAVTVSAISDSMNTRNQLGYHHLDPPFTEGETLDILVFQQRDISFRTTKCKLTAVWNINDETNALIGSPGFCRLRITTCLWMGREHVSALGQVL